MSNLVYAGKDLVLDLVNRRNTLSLPLDLDNANVLGRVYDPTDHVKIGTTVAAMPTSIYEGSVQVEIERVDLTAQYEEFRPRLVGTGATTLHDMLEWVSRELGMELNTDDFRQVKFVWLSEREQVNILIESHKDSLVYCGKFLLHFTRRRKTLVEAIVNYEADTLHFPNLTHKSFLLGKMSVTPRTWAFDFTEHYNAIRKHKDYNILGNPSGCRALMQSKFGFSNWPYGWGNKTTDFPTSAIKEANKDYDRVVIQHLRDETFDKRLPYEGIAYFHYNEI